MKRFQQAFSVAFDDRPSELARVDELMRSGLTCHQAGKIEDASQFYEMALRLRPNHPDGLNLLGVAEMQRGNLTHAIVLTEKATRFDPKNFSAFTNLGNARLANGDALGAIEAFRKANRLQPNDADIHYNLANALQSAEKFEDALYEYNQAVRLNPSKAEAWFNRGNLLAAQENLKDAVASYEKAAQLVPTFPNLLTNLACALAGLEEMERAEVMFRQALTLDPHDACALNNLGCLLIKTERYAEAVPITSLAVQLYPQEIPYRHNQIHSLITEDLKQACACAEEVVRMDESCALSWWLLGIVKMEDHKPSEAVIALEKAIELDPENFKDNNNLGIAYSMSAELDKALNFYEHSLIARPEDAEGWADVAIAQMNAGQIRDSIASLRKSRELNPSDQYAHSNLLMILCYSPDYDNMQLLEEAKTWGRIHTPTDTLLPQIPRVRGAKLRIGYVSPDFHDHPAGRVYERLFKHHDRSRFDLTIYCNNETADEVTRQTVAAVDRWRLVQKLTDRELAEQIRKDEIDILIDLVGHTPNHRLKAFGYKPAPVQATWLGYFATTGMPQMDFIFADDHLIPAEHEPNFTERIARMPGSFYVFNAPPFDVPITPPPVVKNGFITFGCLNNTAKITPEVIEAWCQILREIPDSRMFMNRWPFQSPTVRQTFQNLFEKNGVDGSRVDFAHTFTRKEYFESYAAIDIMLDTFPFGAGTTTTEAAWMGVPVVSLTTDRLAGRMTQSIYYQLGLEDMLPETLDDFIELGVRLARHPAFLTLFRKEMRSRTESSRLMDFPQYAKDLESVFEYMWENRSMETDQVAA